ncbi:MAG: hypothetical protein ACJ71K_12370 [Nitrososphaeraceae archaeon]
MKMIVDIDLWNCQIRSFRPEIQTPMPNDDLRKMLFWNSSEPDRLNKRQLGHLRGRALRKAERIVDKYGGINKHLRRIWQHRNR